MQKENIIKIVLSMFFFLTQVFALELKDYENIAKFYENKLNNNDIKIKVSFKEKLTHPSIEFETILLEFTQNDSKTIEPIFIKDGYFFTEFVDLKEKKSYREFALKIIKEKQDLEILTTLKKQNNFITLGSGNKNVYVFSDPNCPYCKKHLENLNETYLKEHKIHIIPVGFLNSNSLLKSISINKELSFSKKNDVEILKILKSYYEKGKNEKILLIKANEKELKNK